MSKSSGIKPRATDMEKNNNYNNNNNNNNNNTTETDFSESPNRLPGWVLGWFYATAAICTWDASFIILRPLSLPGGSLHPVWYPYRLYIGVDQRYKDIGDPFVYGISLLNYAEVVLNIITIWLHYKNSRHTVPLAFTVSVMTFWKTVFYFYAFTELGGGAPYRVGNTALQEFVLVVIPNGFWIILPLLAMIGLWARIIPAQVPPTSDWSSQHSNGHVKGHVRNTVLHAKHT